VKFSETELAIIYGPGILADLLPKFNLYIVLKSHVLSEINQVMATKYQEYRKKDVNFLIKTRLAGQGNPQKKRKTSQCLYFFT